MDGSDVVHHAVYPRWLENPRMSMWRQRGVDVHVPGQKQRVGKAVGDLCVRCRHPASFDNAYEIEMGVGVPLRASVRVDYREWRAEPLLAEAEVTAACIELDRMRAARIPAAVRACC